MDATEDDFLLVGQFLHERPGATALEIAETFGFYTVAEASSILSAMRKAGRVINGKERGAEGDAKEFYLHSAKNAL